MHQPERFMAGFSFIEVMIVVMILGIMAMAGLPMLHSAMDEARLSGAADEIVTALEFSQMTAMTSGGQTRVTIDAAAETILVEQFKTGIDLLGAENELSEADVEGGSFVTMEYPLNRGVDYSISLASEDRFKGIDITTAAFGTGNNVTFGPLGAPSDGGTVTVALGSRQIVVTLDSVTGKVTLSE